MNTGDWNTGYMNTGDRNTGDWNTGDRNTGYMNTGDRNTGDRNTGDWNTGDRNTGDWNTGDYETGFFNTKSSKTINVFNKSCKREDWIKAQKPDFLYFPLTEWIISESMTKEEKESHPTYKTTGGYLKKYEYKEAFKNSWNNATKEDRELVKSLPNFDAKIFHEISGIMVDGPDCEGREVEIDGVMYVLKKK